MPADARLALRGTAGGALMGLANLVPGISGGTMLLATGVYPGFVSAIAELTALRVRARSLLLLGSIGGAAALVILFLAGPTKTLVIEQRWVMYSLFIGLTLGGVPIVWRLARPVTLGFGLAAGASFLALVALTALSPADSARAESGAPELFVAGVAGAAAMILPGVSGGYLLLLLGQYVPILSAVDAFKQGLLAPLCSGGPPEWALVREALRVAVPVGVGVGVGIVAVSHLVRFALERVPKPTLGALLGLLLGAVVGLWPFERSVAPDDLRPTPGHEELPLDPEHWPIERFRPSPLQIGGSLLLVAAGLAVTSAIGRLGGPANASRPE